MHICMHGDVKLWPQCVAVRFVVCTVYSVCIWIVCVCVSVCPWAAVLVWICFSSLWTWLRWSAPLYMPASASGLVRLARGLQWSKMHEQRKTYIEKIEKHMFIITQMSKMHRFLSKIFVTICASIIISWKNHMYISYY